MPKQRPAVDVGAMEASRARTELALFGAAPPATIGRYHVRAPIAGGGMGMVYGGYDPQLDRKVALKVVHPRRGADSHAQQRMLTEARALAKLDHPNVVKVHDILSYDDQLVIVMELIEGQTLSHWETQGSRTWSELVRVYAQAGDGLAAAHSVDVIHRDFKPNNVIVGDDDRVRVLDFGLARLTGGVSDTVPVTESGSGDVPGLTAPGAVIGTLGYSAPEQLEAVAVTAASDQFSFCVALHRALEGAAPYAGDDPRSLVASMRAGVVTIARDRRSVPAWLRGLLASGLSYDPAKRHASISSLVALLRRPRGWKRWRWPVLATAAVGAGIVLTAAFRSGDDTRSCDGAPEEINGAWNGRVGTQIRDVIAQVDAPYARDVSERVVDRLNVYAVDWAAQHRDACTSHRRGSTSAALLDRQMICLQEHRADLTAAVSTLLRTDAASIANVMDVIAGLPPIPDCGDLERLASAVAPPPREVRATVDTLKAQISVAKALDRAGRSEEALEIVTKVSGQASRTSYKPVFVEATLTMGRILLATRDLKAAASALGMARRAALEATMLNSAVEASARLIYVEGLESPSIERMQRDAAFAEPLSTSLVNDTFVRPLLLNNMGTVYLAAGDRDNAVRYFGLARSALPDRLADLELTVIDRNLSMLTADPLAREALARGVWERLRHELGEDHVDTLDALVSYAQYVLSPARARRLIGEACSAYAALHPTLIRQRVFCLGAEGLLARELGDIRTAMERYESAIEIGSDSDDPDISTWVELLTGELAVVDSRPRDALRPLLSVISARAHSEYWWERLDALRADLSLGLAYVAIRDDLKAIPHLERVVTDYPALMRMNEDVEYRRRLATARLALSAALLRLGVRPSEAWSLRATALAFYAMEGIRPPGEVPW